MEEFNLVNFGNMGEPVAGIINKFIDKISDALSWIAKPKGIKAYEIEASKSIIEEIAGRKDINPIERAAIVSNLE